ncbi:hypothetical protein GUITHDRAFT_141136 [Guillardia theta CCMP2712]|uniref:Anaphase-promoting complex subunit 4-like WD40 domain-containing protein n=1 Tax=Guillardia theta (strain CCMP2712) TaxID=905079 RepID=L1J1R2_GUITC|nr:hypothetical protein GUITHDRAFT_141136 [Guillardia theta CCMP2712]EKX42446.1 hypothetical protein GUITHDRAFT_141136 [Guillardia theta CCMP2712]|eukprot:XP_005829426.1 hypothetical protein GUITHDRAFT_141136 [Guillardia theta CCMP2712]
MITQARLPYSTLDGMSASGRKAFVHQLPMKRRVAAAWSGWTLRGDEKRSRSEGDGRSGYRGSLVSADGLRAGPKHDLQTQARELGLTLMAHPATKHREGAEQEICYKTYQSPSRENQEEGDEEEEEEEEERERSCKKVQSTTAANDPRGIVVSSDDLVLGRKFDLQEDAEALGMIVTPQGRYVLGSSRQRRMFASSLASGQILWESDGPVTEEDVKEVLHAMTRLDQSIHINTGTHGTADGGLLTAGGNTIDFFFEDYRTIKELEQPAKVSIHMVTSQSDPFLPLKANMVINAWCHSCMYGFADKVDIETGRIVEWTYGSLPRRLREILKQMLGDEESVDDAMECFVETSCSETDPDVDATARVSSDHLLDKFMHNTGKRVLLLLGMTGAGKSTLGKRWAIQMGEAWQVCERVFRGSRIADIGRGAVLAKFLLDSYDEMGTMENVVEKVFKELAGCRGIKTIVTCRSGYLKKEGKSNTLFWPPGLEGRDALQVAWVCELSLSNKEQVNQYIDNHIRKRVHTEWSKKQYDEAIRSMPELQFIVSTPYTLKVLLVVLPSLHRKFIKKPKYTLTRHNIHKEYAKEWYRREWDKLKQNVNMAIKVREEEVDDGNFMAWYSNAAQQLCLHMLMEHKNFILHKAEGSFLAGPPFNLSMREGKVEKKLGYWLLRGCLTRLKVHKHQNTLEVSFAHDMLRSFFLARATFAQLQAQIDGAPASLSVRCGAFEPGGEALATVSKDGKMRVWDVETGKCMRELGGGGEEIDMIRWRADGKRLASGSRRGRIRVWDVEAGECCLELLREEEIGEIGWMGDERIAWWTHREKYCIQTMDVELGVCTRERELNTAGKHSMRLGPDGRKLAGVSKLSGQAWVWDVETGRGQELQGPEGGVTGLIWGPDGRRLAGVSKTGGGAWVWDAETGRGQELQGPEGGVTGLIWGPDGRRLAGVSKTGGGAWVWDAETGRGQELEGPEGGLEQLIWGPEGKRLFTRYTSDGSIKTWTLRDEGFFVLTADFNRYERVLVCRNASIDQSLSSPIRRLLEERGAVAQANTSTRGSRCCVQ